MTGQTTGPRASRTSIAQAPRARARRLARRLLTRRGAASSRNAAGSIAVFAYRELDPARFAGIVRDIDRTLQLTDTHPRRITWDGADIAMIDRDETRIALGLRPVGPAQGDSHLVLAIGRPAEGRMTRSAAAQCVQLVDRLSSRLAEDLPYASMLRDETTRPVDAALIRDLFTRLTPPARAPEADTSPAMAGPRAAAPCPDPADFAVIATEDVAALDPDVPRFLSERAAPTAPLRLTVHLTGAMVALISAPLGAFMLTYSLLRDTLSREG